MRHTRKHTAASIAAAGFMLCGALAYGQELQTPYSPNESASTPAELEAADRALSGVAEPQAPAQGGTLAPEAGGSLQLEGGSMDRLPLVPDSGPDADAIDD